MTKDRPIRHQAVFFEYQLPPKHIVSGEQDCAIGGDGGMRHRRVLGVDPVGEVAENPEPHQEGEYRHLNPGGRNDEQGSSGPGHARFYRNGQLPRQSPLDVYFVTSDARPTSPRVSRRASSR